MVEIRNGSELLHSISHLLVQPFDIFHVSLGILFTNIEVHWNVFGDFAEINDWNRGVSISLDILFITSIVILSKVVGESVLTVVEELFEGGATVYLLIVQIIGNGIVIRSIQMENLVKLRASSWEFEAESSFILVRHRTA